MDLLVDLLPDSVNCHELGHTWDPSCVQSVKDVAVSVFVESLKIYSSIFAASAILKKDRLKYLLTKLPVDTLRSSIFLTVNGSGFIGCLCLYRRILGKFTEITVGFFPSLTASMVAIMLERKSRRKLLALYMCTIAAESLYRMGRQRRLFSAVPYGEVLILAVASAGLSVLYRRDKLEAFFKNLSQYLVEDVDPGRPGPAGLAPPPTADQPEQIRSRTKSSLNWLMTFYRSRLTSHCHHRNGSAGCLGNAVRLAIRNFCSAYLLHVGINLLTVSLPVAFRQGFRSFFSSVFHHCLAHSSCRGLATFLGLFSLIFKVLSCSLPTLKVFRSNEDLTQAISGFVAGLSFYFYRSPTIALYVIAKLIDQLYLMGVESGRLPKLAWADVILYSLATAVAFHAAVFEMHNLRQSYWAFLMRVTHGRIAFVNRQVLDCFGTDASRSTGSWWPDSDKFVAPNLDQFFQQLNMQFLPVRQ